MLSIRSIKKRDLPAGRSAENKRTHSAMITSYCTPAACASYTSCEEAYDAVQGREGESKRRSEQKSEERKRVRQREEEWEVGGMGCMHVKVVGKERERQLSKDGLRYAWTREDKDKGWRMERSE